MAVTMKPRSCSHCRCRSSNTCCLLCASCFSLKILSCARSEPRRLQKQPGCSSSCPRSSFYSLHRDYDPINAAKTDLTAPGWLSDPSSAALAPLAPSKARPGALRRGPCTSHRELPRAIAVGRGAGAFRSFSWPQACRRSCRSFQKGPQRAAPKALLLRVAHLSGHEDQLILAALEALAAGP